MTRDLFLALACGAILTAAFMITSPAWAQQNCDSAVEIPVTVTPEFDEPKYDFTASIDDIAGFTTDSAHSIHEIIPLGVTHYKSILRFNTPVRTVILPDGTACTTLQRADLTIGYNSVTVYIAHEVPQGSCGFNEVMAHEQKHIAVNWQVLQEYVPRIRERIMDYLKSNSIFRGQSHEDDLARMQQKFQAMLDEMGRQIMDDNVMRQREVDSPEEYGRLSMVCNGQLAAIVGHSLVARP